MLYLKNDYDNDDKCHLELGMRFLITDVWTKSYVEAYRESGCKPPAITDLGSGWASVASYVLHLLYSWDTGYKPRTGLEMVV
jgi:hypothetical protein